MKRGHIIQKEGAYTFCEEGACNLEEGGTFCEEGAYNSEGGGI